MNPNAPVKPLSFDNTEIAFSGKNEKALSNAYLLFKAIGINSLVKAGPFFVKVALTLHLPIEGLIRSTIFAHFCGGENINDCDKTIRELQQFKIGTILDYSVEGKETEHDFDACATETLATIARAKGDPAIPFCVFKVTGLARFALLEKLDAKQTLTPDEVSEFDHIKTRVNTICLAAHTANVPILIDAEESWIQDTIDGLATKMMELYNKERAIVYNTIQLYRHDRLVFLKQATTEADTGAYFLGVKLVRGAYMEKERARAAKMGYPSPIQHNKEATDNDYDLALTFCMQHLERIAICAGTHNEHSSLLLTELMELHQVESNHPHVCFSQLLGMSDHISYNLAAEGYRVAKYVPYGPVKAVLPYLIRRANENTSISGQIGRELGLILKEQQRRKELK